MIFKVETIGVFFAIGEKKITFSFRAIKEIYISIKSINKNIANICKS